MNKQERDQVRELVAKNKGDVLTAVAKWLGKEAEDALKGAAKAIAKEELKYPVGWDAAFHNIIDEVERYAEADTAEDDAHAEKVAQAVAASGNAGDGKTPA